MLIIIPTKDRIKELKTTLSFLNNNNFFFKKIIIVDASNFQIKKEIKKTISNYNLDIELVDSKPSTCLQRNKGFNFLNNNEYIMFLDDDNIFNLDAFYKMQIFLKTHKNFVGVAWVAFVSQALSKACRVCRQTRRCSYRAHGRQLVRRRPLVR